jgi:glucose-1-phosphate thymidylyltransferase
MKCLILASGFGTRLYPFNIDRAKGLIEYKGKALISRIVDLIPQDVEILVNTNKKFEEDFRRWKEKVNRSITLCVEQVYSEEEAYGAIGSLDFWIKTKKIDDDLMVIASDNYFEFDLEQFISSYNGNNVLVAVHDIGDIEKASQYGVVQVEGKRIIEFEEKPVEPKSTLIATACYVLPPSIFPVISEYCLTDKRDNLGSFIAYLMGKDEVNAYVFKEQWFDIGSIDIYKSTQTSQ